MTNRDRQDVLISDASAQRAATRALSLPLSRCAHREMYPGALSGFAARYAEFEIIGSPEIRVVDRDRQRFNPHTDGTELARRAAGDEPQQRLTVQAIPPTLEPASLHGFERFLLLVLLRRYVTYCARRGRFAAMNGAARLYAAVAAQVGAN